jgi:hypothetical protein
MLARRARGTSCTRPATPSLRYHVQQRPPFAKSCPAHRHRNVVPRSLCDQSASMPIDRPRDQVRSLLTDLRIVLVRPPHGVGEVPINARRIRARWRACTAGVFADRIICQGRTAPHVVLLTVVFLNPELEVSVGRIEQKGKWHNQYGEQTSYGIAFLALILPFSRPLFDTTHGRCRRPSLLTYC